MAAVAAAAKKAGQVDYGTDKAAAVEFDSLFAAAKASPANASLTPAQLVEKAHKAVLALRGISAAPAPAPAAAAPAAAPAPRAAPPSIGGLPNAAPAIVQDDLMAQFSNLEGEDAERFLAGLPANQVAKLRRTTDNPGIHGCAATVWPWTCVCWRQSTSKCRARMACSAWPSPSSRSRVSWPGCASVQVIR